MRFGCVVAVCCLLGLGACAVESAPSDADATAARSCEQRATDIETCLADADQTGAYRDSCEPTIAAFEQACPEGKADWYGDWLCGLGVLRHCPTPACDVPAVGEADRCAVHIDADGCASCDYYLCREAAAGATACGDDGYYLDYGYRYCQRLTLVTRPVLSDAGKRWNDATRRCLMEQLEGLHDTALACADLTRFAFDSHPNCYIESGFCSLPLSDWWSVMATVDSADLELRQVLTTGIGCLTGLSL